MELPNEVLLSKIAKRGLYYDKKSKEETTGVIKPKYKLAGNNIPAIEQYFFHVLATTLSVCKASVTLRIRQQDWEERVKGSYLPKDISYCDLTKFEIMDGLELLEKIKDKKNGFPYVAKLCSSKYEKLKKLGKKMKYDTRISDEAIKIVINGLSDSADEIAMKLGLI